MSKSILSLFMSLVVFLSYGVMSLSEKCETLRLFVPENREMPEKTLAWKAPLPTPYRIGWEGITDCLTNKLCC